MACTKTLMVTNIAGNGIVLQKKVKLNRQVGSLRHSIEEERSVSAMKLRVRKKGKQRCGTMVAMNKGELISENSTTVKLSALVTVRNNKVLGSEMVNNLLTIFLPQNHTKALLLQLVSTNLDPGTSQPSIHPFYLFLLFSGIIRKVMVIE